jgi:hypothetical protein
MTDLLYKEESYKATKLELLEAKLTGNALTGFQRTVPETDPKELVYLIKESTELKNILGSIVRRT